MKKIYPLLFFYLISYTAFAQALSEKIVLNPSMVTNESSYGDPGMLVDEQVIANDPLNGVGGAPQTNWFPGWGDKHPASAYVDLGENYQLSHILIYDANGKGDFIVEYGEPGNWISLFTDPLNNYQYWETQEVSINTRYLRFTRMTGASNAHEIVLYGSPASASQPVLSTIGDQMLKEGETLTLLLTAIDPDDGSLTFSLDSGAEFIVINNHEDGTATLTFDPPNGTVGFYTVSVTVTNDSGGQATASFNLTIDSSGPGSPPSSGLIQTIGLDLNDWRGDPPSSWNGLSSASVGASVENLKNQLEQNTDYSVEVVDNFNGTGLSNLSTGNNSGPVPDGVMSTFWYNQHNQGILKFVLDKSKTYTFKIYGGRDGSADDKSADYTIGTQSVTLYNFNNIQNAAVITNVIPDENDEVFLKVTSSAGYAYAIINGIIIEEYASGTSNAPPVLAAVGNQTVTEGEVLSINLSASDPDGDQLTFDLSTTADFVTLTDNNDGTARLSISPGTSTAGDYQVTVTVADGNGGVVNRTFTVVIDSEPVLVPTPPDNLVQNRPVDAVGR